jgi:hypothetical protein
MLLAAQAGSADWVAYRGDGFRAEFPRAPHVREETLETPAGPQRVLILNASDAGSSFALTCTTYDAGFVQRAGASRLVAAARQRFLSETDGSLIRERRIDDSRGPAYEVSFLSVDSQRITTARFLLAGERLFSLVTDHPRDATVSPQGERFFENFALALGEAKALQGS